LQDWKKVLTFALRNQKTNKYKRKLSMKNQNSTKRITISTTQKPFLERNETLEMYYSDIRKYDVLTEDVTKELFERFKNASEAEKEEIKETLFNHNSRLVVSLARTYCTANDNLNDLIQEGNIGLLNAIDKFDLAKESSFQKFALFHIRREINLFKLNYSPIVQQTNRSKTDSIVNSIISDFVQREHRNPSPDEILEEYNARSTDQKKVNSTQDVINVQYVYVDSLEQQQEDFTDCQSYLDYTSKSCAHNDYLNQEELDFNRKKIEILMDGLTDKEKQAVRLFYGFETGFDESLHSIGTKMGCSSERARQLCSSALAKMQKKGAVSL